MKKQNDANHDNKRQFCYAVKYAGKMLDKILDGREFVLIVKQKKGTKPLLALMGNTEDNQAKLAHWSEKINNQTQIKEDE